MDLHRGPERHQVMAVLTDHEAGYLLAANTEREGDLAVKAQCVQPRAHSDHSMTAEPLGEDGDPQLDRVRHHDHDLVAAAVASDGVRVAAEGLDIGCGELLASGAAVTGNGQPGRGDDDVGHDVLRIHREVHD